MSRVAPYWKAVVGFVAPGAALIIANGGAMSGRDWIVAAATCVVTGATVYAVPNRTE